MIEGGSRFFFSHQQRENKRKDKKHSPSQRHRASCNIRAGGAQGTCACIQLLIKVREGGSAHAPTRNIISKGSCHARLLIKPRRPAKSQTLTLLRMMLFSDSCITGLRVSILPVADELKGCLQAVACRLAAFGKQRACPRRHSPPANSCIVPLLKHRLISGHKHLVEPIP